MERLSRTAVLWEPPSCLPIRRSLSCLDYPAIPMRKSAARSPQLMDWPRQVRGIVARGEGDMLGARGLRALLPKKKRDPTEPGLSQEISTNCSERLAHWGRGGSRGSKAKTCNIGVGSRLGNRFRPRHGRLSCSASPSRTPQHRSHRLCCIWLATLVEVALSRKFLRYSPQ
jgi:hypothetical protein